MAVITRSKNQKAGKKVVAASVGTRAKKKKTTTTTTTNTTTLAERKASELRQNLQLRQILTIGGDPMNQNRSNSNVVEHVVDDYSSFKHLAWRVTKLIGNGSSNGQQKKAFIYFQEEFDNSVPPKPVRVAIVIICKNIPTLRTMNTSIQLSTNDVRSFKQDGLFWDPLPRVFCKGVYVLKQASESAPLSQYAILPLRKEFVPTETKVRVVTFKHDGVQHVWDTTSMSSSEYADLQEDANGNEWDVTKKEELKGLLLSEKEKSFDELAAKNEYEKTDFDLMKAEISNLHRCDSDAPSKEMVAQNLRKMKVYKIFPSGLPQPKQSVFGPYGGFALTNKVNRFIDAEQYFVE